MTSPAVVTWTELLEQMRAVPERLAELTRAAGPAACVRRGQDEWSVCEIIGHMCAVESPYRARLARIMLEDNPRVAAIGCITGDYDPDTPARILVETMAMLRRETLALLESLAPLDRGRPGVHAELGAVTLRSQVESLSAHDAEHLAHIALLVSQHKDTKTQG